MSKYDVLYEIGEEHLISVLKQPEQCRSEINGLSQVVLFNERDHYTSANGVIHFYLQDENNTLAVVVNLLTNRFTVQYYETDNDDIDHSIFHIFKIPYDISEEWHFQLSTVKEYPFSYEFLTHLKNYVKYFEDMMQINHSIEALREIRNIEPYLCR